MEKSKTSREFLATALGAILVISIISMAIPVMARNSGVSDYDVTAKRIPVELSERNIIEIASGGITIDGDPSDWEGILPILFDTAGDGVDGYCDDDSVVEVAVPLNELGTLPFNMDFLTYHDGPMDEAPDSGHVTYPFDTPEVPDGVTEYWAIIVGVADYVGTLSDLNYADDDAIDMHNTLLSDYHWQADHIQLLIDGDANKSDIQNAFNWLDANEDPDDVVLFFFSGHGTHGPDIAPIDEADGMDEYICPHDLNNIRDDELATELDRLGSTSIVVIIDACFAGGMAKASDHSVKTLSKPRVRIAGGFASDIASPRGGLIRKTDIGNTGRVVLMGCDDFELSIESGGLENSVFSYYVVEGLGGDADEEGNGDGNCSAEETFEYANTRVVGHNLGQHPQIYDGYPGEIPITQIAPVANFTGTPRSGPAPLTVEFTDTSISYDGITSWVWDFGDGTANSTDQNPTHVYSTEGTYNVSLTIGEEDRKNDTDTKENYITVTAVEPIYNVSITSAPIEQTTASNEEVNYTLTIKNSGNVEDTIELNITANEANYSSLSAHNFSLDATETAIAYLYVKDPDGGTYSTTVRATSHGNASVFDVVTVETNVTTAKGGVPTADLLEVENASGMSGTDVVVPVNIENVTNGPVQSIRLLVDYNEYVLNITSFDSGDLTSNWTQKKLGEDRHTVTIATLNNKDAIPNGRSGSIVLLNFRVIGSSGDTTPINLSLIDLSNPDGDVGTAPAKNGSFTVSNLGTIAGRITYACNGTEIAGVVVNLTKEGTVVDTTVTNETGYYLFTDANPGCYFVNAVEPRFFDNSTEVTVTVGETTIVDMMLWLKGDLNNNGIIADAGDVVLMLRASVGDIPGDLRYDLNGNGAIADAGDIVLLLRASIGDIILW